MRKIVDALYLQFVWPGCSKPGYLADYHHIEAAKNGGPTSVWNLTKLCPHHNGRNDDDRQRQLNGYVFVDNGAVRFRPPNDSPPITSAGPIHQLGALAISQSRKLPSLEEALDVPVPEKCITSDHDTQNPGPPPEVGTG